MRKMPIVRKIMYGLFLANALVAMIVYPHTAAAIGLKESSVVTNNTITLGDIFTGLPKDAQKVMGISPQPGHEMVLDANTLLRIALAMNLPWRPENSGDTVVITRAATVVGRDLMEDALKTSMNENGITGSYKLVMAEDPGTMILPKDIEPNVEVSHIDIKQDSSWFQATLTAPSREKPLATKKISGRIERMAKIPVLRQSMNQGSVIGTNDIEYIEVAQRSLKSDIMLDANKLVGMTPRRIVNAGVPVNPNDLEFPQLIERGDVVTMVFNENGLELTAQGKAMEDGAKGDRIRVTNTSSNKTIVAEVTNVKEVTLNSF
jgi:flagellar basal body P-ring formation protein FlgA